MKLYHPTFPGHTVEVPDAKVEDWTEQGWRKSAPKARIVGEKRPERFVPKNAGTVVKRDK